MWENPPMAPPADTPSAPPSPSPGLPGSLWRDLGRGVRSGLRTFWELAKVMVPAYGITLLLQYLGVIGLLARAARPVMSLLGLPGDAAVGSMQALHLSATQITVLAIAILIGHNLLVEGAVLHKAGMNGFAFGALRVVAGLVAAAVANLLMGLVW
jgi:hypothetical protein